MISPAPMSRRCSFMLQQTASLLPIISSASDGHLLSGGRRSYAVKPPGRTPSPCFSQSYLQISSLLHSFVNRKAIEPGKQLHAHLIVSGLGCDAVLATRLVNLYSVCHCLSYAHALFDRIPKRNIFLWNVLIRGYAWDGPHERAIELFQQMLDRGLEPDNFTFPFVLKACSALSNIEVGRCIHDRVMRSRWRTDVFVGAGLIDMFAKCGYVSEAQEMFDRMPTRDAVLWNSMIAAYAHNAYPLRALALCRDMLFNGFKPTEATLVTAISASADASALPRGREIHGFSWRVGFHLHDKVKTALVDMYAKGGWVRAARTLFDQLTEKRVVSWNAMISGYSMHGHAGEALDLFEQMKREGQSKWLVPDHITFVGVLSACRHGGLLELGWELFNSMAKDYSITPTIQHYTCMIDLLGHSGSLEKAYDLIGKMPIRPDSGVWGCLLNACKIHKNVALGEVALQKLIELEPDDAGNYVILSNLYSVAGNWEGVARMRRMMKERGLKKAIACSWIEIKNEVHTFVVGDKSHPRSAEIYAKLEVVEGLVKKTGYVADTMPVFHDVEDDEKAEMVRSHSERLAIAFGLISTAPGTRLLVTKNLRVCEDCHEVIKLVSRIVEREIILRDVNRYHTFKEGDCSCGDYW